MTLSDKLVRTIESKVSQARETDFSEAKVYPISGGDINQAYCFESKGQKYFVKLNTKKYLQMFEAEAQGLSLLAASDCFRVPQVIAYDTFAEHSFLILEYLDLSGTTQIENFAKSLAGLHLKRQQAFGLEQDNFIGLTPQRNTFSHSWSEFFAQNRLAYQLDLLRSKGAVSSSLKSVQQLIESIDGFFIDYQPFPSLLHGDLWQGNYGFEPSGRAAIYDPACYYGDHEADLAMIELFGNPGPRFFDSYNKIFPIDGGYQRRKHLYNLYHILNHANLFGGGYLQQASRMADDLLHRIV